MRGDERVQDEMFSCVTLKQRVPQDHRLREIRKLADAVLVALNEGFDALYLRPAVLHRARVCSAGFIVAGVLLGRSERQTVEQGL